MVFDPNERRPRAQQISIQDFESRIKKPNPVKQKSKVFTQEPDIFSDFARTPLQEKESELEILRSFLTTAIKSQLKSHIKSAVRELSSAGKEDFMLSDSSESSFLPKTSSPKPEISKEGVRPQRWETSVPRVIAQVTPTSHL